MGYLQCTECSFSFSWEALEQWNYKEYFQLMMDDFVLQAILLYWISIPISRRLFQYGKIYQENKDFCKRIMFVYNIFMTFYSGYTAFWSWKIMLEEFNYSNQLFRGFGTSSCHGMFDNPFLHELVTVFYYSKFLEFADTWFLTLRNANVSVLQWYHHGGIVSCMWAFLKFKNEAAFITMTLNASIHTIMYAYFALSIYVKKIPGKFLITSSQLIQFWSGLWSSSFQFSLPCFDSIKHRFTSLVWMHVYCWFLVVLFLNFFIRSYMAPRKKQKSKQS